MSDVLISARNLSVHFPLRGFMFGERPVVRACQGINLDIEKGHFVGLVGESGSGKTTLGRAMLKAAPISEGSVTYTDTDVTYDLASLLCDAYVDVPEELAGALAAVHHGGMSLGPVRPEASP